MQSVARASHIALYPWLVDSIRQPRNKRDGLGRRVRIGDSSYATSLHSFLSWPLDNRRFKIGIISTPSSTLGDEPVHVWVLGIVRKEGGRTGTKGGSLVFIYDEAGTQTRNHFAKKGLVTPRRMLQGMRDALDMVGAKTKRHALYYGGEPLASGNQVCLESSMVFIENFVQMSLDGKPTASILKEYKLVKIE